MRPILGSTTASSFWVRSAGWLRAISRTLAVGSRKAGHSGALARLVGASDDRWLNPDSANLASTGIRAHAALPLHDKILPATLERSVRAISAAVRLAQVENHPAGP